MKSIVIYKGKYGATARYAEWLGNTLQIPVVDAENIARENLAAFDCVIMFPLDHFDRDPDLSARMISSSDSLITK